MLGRLSCDIEQCQSFVIGFARTSRSIGLVGLDDLGGHLRRRPIARVERQRAEQASPGAAKGRCGKDEEKEEDTQEQGLRAKLQVHVVHLVLKNVLLIIDNLQIEENHVDQSPPGTAEEGDG